MFLEGSHSIEFYSFSERELEYFFFLFRRLSMKTFEDEDNDDFNEVNLDEEEGNWLDSAFKEGEELSGDLKLGSRSSFGWFLNLEEE